MSRDGPKTTTEILAAPAQENATAGLLEGNLMRELSLQMTAEAVAGGTPIIWTAATTWYLTKVMKTLNPLVTFVSWMAAHLLWCLPASQLKVDWAILETWTVARQRLNATLALLQHHLHRLRYGGDRQQPGTCLTGRALCPGAAPV